MTPVETLKAAAAKVREAAAKATPGPWTDASTDDDSIYPRWILGPPTVPDDLWSFTEPIKVTSDLLDHEVVSREDVAWIALMNPGLSEPLAAWLEEEGRQYDLPPCDDPTGCCNRCDHNPGVIAALAVARAILGEAP